MITKNQIKHYSSLHKKKCREEAGEFLVEGHRSVLELLGSSLQIKCIVATDEWFADNGGAVPDAVPRVYAAPHDLERISTLQSPPPVIACASIPVYGELPMPTGRLVIALDTVQDPGNLGTIIRTADWFGIDSVVCSRESADVFAPKVVQSTMGALGRVRVFYTDLEHYLSNVQKHQLPIYGTLLDGDDLYRQPLSSEGVILFGNEGNGISDALRKYISSKLYIPTYPPGADNVESLNVGVSAAIVCSEFRRRC